MSKFKVGDIVEVIDNSTNSYKKGELVKIISVGKGIYGCHNSDKLRQSLVEYQIKQVHGEEPEKVKVGDTVIISHNDGYHCFEVGTLCEVIEVGHTSEDSIRVIGMYNSWKVEQHLHTLHYTKVSTKKTPKEPPKKRPQRRVQEETTNDKNQGLYGI